MRELLRAYETLSNPQKKIDYDRAFVRYFQKIRFNYRDFLKTRRADPVSQSRLVFYDLLNSRHREALELYEQLLAEDESFDLERYLGYEDSMDCLFLLAEAMERRGDYVRACEMYKELYVMETSRPYFHHFVDEVIERLRTLTCFKMATTLPPVEAIEYIKEMIRFDFSRKDNAFFYKKIAEIYCTTGHRDLAVKYLRKGLELDQKLPGVKKLKEKIGFSEIPLA